MVILNSVMKTKWVYRIIEVYFYKIDKMKVAGADLSY